MVAESGAGPLTLLWDVSPPPCGRGVVVLPAGGGGVDLPHVSLWFLRCLLPAGKFPESAVRAAVEENAPTAGCCERGGRAL